ncbi:MAG: sulfurtransferase TusA family protein [Nitrospira sp.]|nr:sulfurtransferase TusA family protein [Nitrospira sp.]
MMNPQSVTTPEVVTTPIPPAIAEEIETFETEARRCLSGELSPDLFKPFRLQFGIYGQRQSGVQMVRVKIPFGGITANQLRRLADLVDRYATGVGHVTTRQDIQMHFVELQDVPTIMRGLAEVGLTTREACSNTVRNVTACHLAGVCSGEVFDVTPYAKTVAYHLLRNPLNQSLPRKFKIAFSGCAHDCALTPIHDIGLMAVKREDGTIGFRMVAGGGLGPLPRMAKVLREFTPMDELIPSIEAVIKVFDALGNRKNRHKARMKFVIDKLGFDEFKRRWEEAYVALGYSRPSTQPLRLLEHHDQPAPLIMPTRNGSTSVAGYSTNGYQNAGQDTPFEVWKRSNVIPQKQKGYVTAVIRLFMGDITVDQMRAVADLAERYSNGNLRTTITQNLVIRWISEDQIEAFYHDLAKCGLAEPGAERVEDIIACPGTDSCGLGITSSKGMARALAELFPAGRVPEDLAGVNVKISGCHNSCAQHHIATIGLHGVGKRIGDHTVPMYELHLGGRVNGTAKIGQLTVKLPAKAVPAAITHLLEVYRRDRQAGESLPTFIDRVGKNALKDELIPYTIVPSYEEDPTFYYDWEGEEPFVLEDHGPGECAGGALEMIENGILEADQELYLARLHIEKHQYAMAVNKSYRAVLAAAKALLVTEGLDPSTDAETLSEFDHRIAKKGIVPALYRDLVGKIGDLGSKENTEQFAKEKMAFAKGFVDACRAVTEQMGKDLKLTPLASVTETVAVSPLAAEEAKPTPVASALAPTGAPVYDLRGVACPLNYVKTKLRLEMMEAGERLEVWLDAGEPIRNVPMSLKNDGHKVLSQEPLEPEALHYRVLVEKVGE